MSVVLRKGTRFVHSFWLEEDCKTPVACEVTKIALGTVYWKRVGGSKAEFCFDESKTAKYVRSIIEEAS